MKEISASLIVLAGVWLFTAGAPADNIEGKIAFLGGAILGSIGLLAWVLLIIRRAD
jgi:hypothetical protein